MPPLHSCSFFVVAPRADLERAFRANKPFKSVIGRAWAEARTELAIAGRGNSVVPVLFGDPSPSVSGLMFVGDLLEVTVAGRVTTYGVGNLRSLAGRRVTDLTVASTERPITKAQRQGPVKVFTPRFLDVGGVVERLVPFVSRSALADSIVAAHAANPNSWCLTNPSGSFIRLNVGPIHVQYFGEPGTGLMVDRKLRKRVRLPAGVREARAGPAIADSLWVFSPGIASPELHNALDLAHHALVARAAKRKTSWPTAHRPDVVNELAALTGRELPQPGYAASTERGDDEELVFARHEGVLALREHRVRERDGELVREKKERVLRQTGKLACEACGFDFKARYGELGAGFAECHHAAPLSSYATRGGKTSFDELVIVCSNCHRMLHRRRPWLVVETLAQLVREQDSTG